MQSDLGLTALGLELELNEDDKDMQPLAVLVVVKTFEADGECGVGYKVRATSGLSDVEAYGMAKLAAVRLLQGASFGENGTARQELLCPSTSSALLSQTCQRAGSRPGSSSS